MSLTKVKKKGREWKGALIDRVRRLCDEHDNVYVVRYRNMRNDRFKDFREVLLAFFPICPCPYSLCARSCCFTKHWR